MPSSKQCIQILRLKSHPEGGFYRETYRAKESRTGRSLSTAIYFLLEGKQISVFHRIKSDEVWHFYAGSAIEIFVIHSKTHFEKIKLGNTLQKGERPQAIVPAGKWFASRLCNPNPQNFALAGCTVAPGFDFRDFEIARREKLLKQYPKYRKTILKLTQK